MKTRVKSSRTLLSFLPKAISRLLPAKIKFSLKRPLKIGFLGMLSGALLLAIVPVLWSAWPVAAGTVPPSTALVSPMLESPVNQHLIADLRAAEAQLASQDMGNAPIQRFAAIMSPVGVVPPRSLPDGIYGASAVGGAVLQGDRLVVRGDFSNLSSPLRDYAQDPATPPNPNVTSAVHIHQGEPGKNGPFQYALMVEPKPDGLGGRFMGEYTLSSAQLEALKAGNLYLDLHTQQNRTGEVRGSLRML